MSKAFFEKGIIKGNFIGVSNTVEIIISHENYNEYGDKEAPLVERILLDAYDNSVEDLIEVLLKIKEFK